MHPQNRKSMRLMWSTPFFFILTKNSFAMLGMKSFISPLLPPTRVVSFRAIPGLVTDSADTEAWEMTEWAPSKIKMFKKIYSGLARKWTAIEDLIFELILVVFFIDTVMMARGKRQAIELFELSIIVSCKKEAASCELWAVFCPSNEKGCKEGCQLHKRGGIRFLTLRATKTGQIKVDYRPTHWYTSNVFQIVFNVWSPHFCKGRCVDDKFVLPSTLSLTLKFQCYYLLITCLTTIPFTIN